MKFSFLFPPMSSAAGDPFIVQSGLKEVSGAGIVGIDDSMDCHVRWSEELVVPKKAPVCRYFPLRLQVEALALADQVDLSRKGGFCEIKLQLAIF